MAKTHFFYKKPTDSFEAFQDGEKREFETLTLDEDKNLELNSNLWDEAHAIKTEKPDIEYIEPNVTSKNISPEPSALETETSGDNGYDDFWPFPKDAAGEALKMIWHLGDEFSQLKSARDTVNVDKVIRIAHLDTGYDPGHKTFPKDNIEMNLQKNYVENNNSAIDIGSEGWLKQPGHGAGTLSILAGNKIKLSDYNYDDYLGIHKGIKIVPIRMSKSVILWKNKAFIDAMNYVISLYDNPATRCHIVTMSMGGLPLKAWAEVVNRAYEKGIFVVTAAGNNFGRLTPNKVIYPARFNRVIAACGVTFDYSPYYKHISLPGIDNMQGNFGPRKIMRTAVAAFTPNVPWAIRGSIDKVSIQGAGTSSATPQIASAAALYYQKHFDELEALSKPWMKVEAIRQALVKTAEKKIAPDYNNDIELYFGNGIIQARKMLEEIPVEAELKKEDEDVVSWPFVRLITGLESMENEGSLDKGRLEMFETEMLQLVQQSKQLQDLLENEEIEFQELGKEKQRVFYTTVIEMPESSQALKKYIQGII